ncbi:ATP-binding protein [Spongiibacter taiwanensis]|uniref:ATP-binding protein n=1 Tax=Spongiibacter taiwanensis TaxID=1748242 RepID=UPI00203647C0|nr:ATP-binding protein [Spongiibacter taiwanensis]USA43863.1 ATP-binding protein [Spongiibacter taiwanensis]
MPVIGLLVFSNALLLYLTLANNRQQLLQNTATELAASSALQMQYFQNSMEELQGDVRFLARTPPIDGMMRAVKNQGFDRDDASSLDAWLGRLTHIFVEMLKTNPLSSQLRLLDANGAELIRVDRYGPGGSVRVVPKAELQNKSARSYFLVAKTMAEGEVYLSDIDLNREHGEIVKPFDATIRALTPIRTDEGELFGVLIKNHNLNATFAAMKRLDLDARYLIIANHWGEYLVHPSPEHEFRFEFGERDNIVDQIPPMAPMFENRAMEEIQNVLGWEGTDYHFHARRVVYGPDPERNQLTVYVSEADSTILLPYKELRNRLLLYLAAILLVAGVISAALARHLARPIAKITDELRSRHLDLPEENLPLNAPGEVGELARGFAGFSAALRERRASELREIEERKQAERQLIAQNEKLTQANDELTQFAYIASHDLQEPLRTVRSFVDLFRQYYSDALDSQGKTFLGFIDESSARMSDLVKGLLDYSRLGKEVVPEEVNLQEEFELVCQDLHHKIRASGATVYSEGLPTIYGLKMELRMLLQNLISNAIKFQRPDVAPVVDVSVHPGEEGYLISIADNGIGIEQQYLQRVFLIFQRLHTRDQIEGAGIGLAHCKKIVEMHGGRIWIESTLNEGTTVFFTLKEFVREKA